MRGLRFQRVYLNALKASRPQRFPGSRGVRVAFIREKERWN